MRIVADANIPRAAMTALSRLGHEVISATEALGPGASDDAVADLAGRKQAAVLTTDADFKRLRCPEGCVVVCLGHPSGARIADAAVRGVARLEHASGTARVVVERDRSVRLLRK